MQYVYVHAMGNEGLRELEIAKGIRTREETLSPAQIELQPKYCPICKESNKHNAKFCFKCNFIISKEGWLEDKEKEAEESKKKMQELEAKQEILQANAANVLGTLMAAEMGAKPPRLEIITWNSDKGSEGLFKAAEITRAKNQARERDHQQRHHNPNNRRLVI